MRYESQVTVVEGDLVLLHGRFSGLGEGVPNWVVVAIVRMEDGILAEHWDVIQDEATPRSPRAAIRCSGANFRQWPRMIDPPDHIKRVT